MSEGTEHSIELSLVTVESVISGRDDFLRRFPVLPRRPENNLVNYNYQERHCIDITFL